MQAPELPSRHPSPEPANAGDDYFGNPYRTRHEQYGFEYLDRTNSQDEIESVVILGYN